MAGDPQRVVLSIQCWHSATLAVTTMFLSRASLGYGWWSWRALLVYFLLTVPPPAPHFANSLESSNSRFFLGKYRLLNNLELSSLESCTCAPLFSQSWTRGPRAPLLVLDNDGMIWLWNARSDVTMRLWKSNRRMRRLAWTFKILAQAELGRGSLKSR
jgi:hypothetical protein